MPLSLFFSMSFKRIYSSSLFWRSGFGKCECISPQLIAHRTINKKLHPKAQLLHFLLFFLLKSETGAYTKPTKTSFSLVSKTIFPSLASQPSAAYKSL